ncbi:hypothetical protein [Streptomyces sp. NRRL F-2664]|uniref:hypothetical protein n=1 Tax=Streptomyces sp. NRRL F-2664 TaxID=1463842 RepID=UPI00131E60C6|nr:hypothetical protein [Streptomyces sp. NRRL F-2664]
MKEANSESQLVAELPEGTRLVADCFVEGPDGTSWLSATDFTKRGYVKLDNVVPDSNPLSLPGCK